MGEKRRKQAEKHLNGRFWSVMVLSLILLGAGAFGKKYDEHINNQGST